ncbi:hypothetical protein EOA36_23850, partial [Mesorhizobium sp. M8A.F.Ca.ET.021.01.1.1]
MKSAGVALKARPGVPIEERHWICAVTAALEGIPSERTFMPWNDKGGGGGGPWGGGGNNQGPWG